MTNDQNPTTAPAITSLGDFHVGGSHADPNVIEVRFVLTDKSEARDWAVWLFQRQDEAGMRGAHGSDENRMKPLSDCQTAGKV